MSDVVVVLVLNSYSNILYFTSSDREICMSKKEEKFLNESYSLSFYVYNIPC